MKPRIFFDANILVAVGLRPKGDYSALLELDNVHLMTSDHILRDVEENLIDLGVSPTEFLQKLRSLLQITDQFTKLPIGLPLQDEEDRQALAEAIGADCAEFITFNSQDFGPLYGQTVLGVLIRHPVDFRAAYLKKPKA